MNQHVCRIQNLHISQTYLTPYLPRKQFVEFKIYISLKHGVINSFEAGGL